ncbi:MAG: hypothetical protein Q8R10_20410 [Pseudomonas sp.]|nr:hypothetical protein [Pseudomonas sp.]MDP3848787.1 hypothetical protein [Pseudomonas sp.]
MNIHAIRAIYLFDELPRDLAGNPSESSPEDIFVNPLRSRP